MLGSPCGSLPSLQLLLPLSRCKFSWPKFPMLITRVHITHQHYFWVLNQQTGKRSQRHLAAESHPCWLGGPQYIVLDGIELKLNWKLEFSPFSQFSPFFPVWALFLTYSESYFWRAQLFPSQPDRES